MSRKMTANEFRKIAEVVIQSLPTDIPNWWIENQDILRSFLREILVPDNKTLISKPSESPDKSLMLVTNTYDIEVYYEKNVNEKFGLSRFSIAQHFSTAQEGWAKVNVALICPTRELLTNVVLHEFKKMGYRPGNICELVALSKQYPKLQQNFTIVALGSIYRNWLNDLLVPYLWGHDKGPDDKVCGLHLMYVGSSATNCWSKNIRFLAVRV